MFSLTLKLETIVYTSMYSVLTLLCTNGGHVTDQMKVTIFIDTVYQKGYFTMMLLTPLPIQILGYIV